MKTPKWKASLSMYRQQTALKFPSTEAADSAIELFWNDDDLYDMPRAPGDGETIIVPMEAVELLKQKGLTFVEKPVATAGSLR